MSIEFSDSSNDNSKLINYNKYKSFSEISKIGSGGFGSVYKVKNMLDDNTYALKKIKLNNNVSVNILNEIRILAKLDHKYIVRYYNAWIDINLWEDEEYSSDSSVSNSSVVKYGDEDICLYIQMKLYPYTLDQWIKNKNEQKLVVIEEVDIIYKQLCQGIRYIHENNIVHCDLKPSNIFIDYDKKIKIGDFGLAKYKEQEFNLEDGSLLYLPKKENVENVKYLDIYALGVILVELLIDFNTGVERINCLKKLKEGIIDERIKNDPKYYDIIKGIFVDKIIIHIG
jgi:serine/threonine protein kinase